SGRQRFPTLVALRPLPLLHWSEGKTLSTKAKGAFRRTPNTSMARAVKQLFARVKVPPLLGADGDGKPPRSFDDYAKGMLGTRPSCCAMASASVMTASSRSRLGRGLYSSQPN